MGVDYIVDRDVYFAGNALIIGMGIGELYKDLYKIEGQTIYTVDTNPAKEATFENVDQVLQSGLTFKTAHICTPNFTHEEIAYKIAPISDIVFVEKPGVINHQRWERLVLSNPNTRFMMVKNNQFRDEAYQQSWRSWYAEADHVQFLWLNHNRIPWPGSWFTTKSKAFGGVSRDLMPHLLSIYQVLNKDWMLSFPTEDYVSYQRHTLTPDLTTEYGQVNLQGTYDVDDYAMMLFGKNEFIADWKSDQESFVGIKFHYKDGTIQSLPLGFCPAEAYQTMIRMAKRARFSDEFWKEHLKMDIWLHQQMEKLS